MPYFNIFELEFENNTVIFEISTLKFVYLQHFEKKQKYLRLGPKMSYFSIFSGWNLKTILSYWKSATSNLPNYEIL